MVRARLATACSLVFVPHSLKSTGLFWSFPLIFFPHNIFLQRELQNFSQQSDKNSKLLVNSFS